MTYTGQSTYLPPQRTPAPPPVGDPSSGPGLLTRRWRELRRWTAEVLRGSPGRIRFAGMLGVVGGIVFAVLGLLAVQARAAALDGARNHAAQLVRIQQISTDLVVADSQFTNGYLTYGLESSDALTTYQDSVQDAANLITEAAEAEPADAERLAQVNQALTNYTARVASARANNTQGFQVATGYLRQASTLLQSQESEPNLLPTLTDLASVNAERVDDSFAESRRATWLMLLAVLGGLGSLLLAQLIVARRSHRFVNIPMASGTVAVVVVLLMSGISMLVAQSAATRAKENSYAATVALANARIAAYAGRSYANITLIYIGTGGDYLTSQDQYEEQVSLAQGELSEAADLGVPVDGQYLTDWSAEVSRINKTALGNWTEAAQQATATTDDSANARFEAFDRTTSGFLRQQSTEAAGDLRTGRAWLVVSQWLAAIAGAFAAVASWIGVTARLEEYR
jgi:hypothetical protein